MTDATFDIVIIGAGSGGITAANFAAKLGARTALVEKDRIGGDCTWTGCVPSKALLKAAKVAHDARTASQYGISVSPPTVDMAQVKRYVAAAIGQVYEYETPDTFENAGVEVIHASAQFLDAETIRTGDRIVKARAFLITTGARPIVPYIPGLDKTQFITYEQVFDIDRLPKTMTIIGGGPIGVEMAQAYQRLGSQVTVVDVAFLPREEPEARELMLEVLRNEGVRYLEGLATAVGPDGGEIVIDTPSGQSRSELLLVATGRAPNLGALGLEKAGVRHSSQGIEVDDHLRTSVRHIYAAGDVTGGVQFTHFAAWQAFQAVRNALLPGHSSGFTSTVPWVTYTDPEIAHIGLTEEVARERFGDAVGVHRQEMSHVDRAVCENDTRGFLKVVTTSDGTILGATIVASRAGEVVTEFVFAIEKKLRLRDLAGTIHPYPTYSTAVGQLAADDAVNRTLAGTKGKVIRGISKLVR